MAPLRLFVVLIFLAYAAAATLDDALSYLTKRGPSKYNEDLLALASIPSVSSLPEHTADIDKAARWLVKRLTAAGFEDAKLLPSDQQPAVYAEWLHAPGQPTVLLYGHYDVQPADPLELWDRPPFQPHIENGSFWGRGVSDDKGGLLQPIHAVEAYLKSSGKLPVNVKIILEGQEEIGSPDLPAFLRKHKRELAADTVVSADGGQISEDQGGIAIGLRGAAAFEVEATTLSTDVHSGTFGGSVMNANVALSKFLQTLYLPSNAVNISGFYKDVKTPTNEDLVDMELYAFDEQRVRESIGATEAFGEEGFSSLARLWVRPTCEVVGMWGGFTGTGVKTIVPAKATAKVVCRLVPEQHPEEIIKAAQAKVEAASIPGTRLTFRKLGFSGKPYLMERDTPTNRAVATVLKQLLPKPPLYVRFGGSIPATGYFKEILGIETSMFAWGLEGNRVHAPNERYGVKQYETGREGFVRLLQQLAVSKDPISASQDAPPAASEADAEL